MLLSKETMNALGYWWSEYRRGRFAWVEENGYGYIEGTEEGADATDVHQAIYAMGKEEGERITKAEFQRGIRELLGLD